MKFIKPNEISSKIMTLIDETEGFVLLVSPYVKISKWYKLVKKMNRLKNRGIPYEVLIREGNDSEASEELQQMGINFSTRKDLHCKLYMNEKYAIVSSMNLLLSSEINSIEIAYQTQSEKEYSELKEFCKVYLDIDIDQYFADNYCQKEWQDYVYDILENRFDGYINLSAMDNNRFDISTKQNRYSAIIRDNILEISGILSGKEYDFLIRNRICLPKVEGVYFELEFGNNKRYHSILGYSSSKLNTSNLNKVRENETKLIAKKIVDFITVADDFKSWSKEEL